MILSKSRLLIPRIVKSFLFISLISVGQAFGQPGDTDIGDPDVPPGIPVDGGIGILLAAGALVGARKLYKSKKEQQIPTEVGYHSPERE